MEDLTDYSVLLAFLVERLASMNGSTGGLDNRGYQGPSVSKNDQTSRKSYKRKDWRARYSGGLKSLTPVRKKINRLVLEI